MWQLLLVCVFSGTVFTTDPMKCCPENQVVLRSRPLQCWDPVSNTTTNDNLPCKMKVKISRFHFDTDGQLVLRLGDTNITVTKSSYCTGRQTVKSDVELKNANAVVLVCSEDEKNMLRHEVSGYCMIVSVVFLFVTAAIYLALPELRDLLGKSMISFCCTVGLGLMVLSIMKLKVSFYLAYDCIVRGYLAYYFIISSFFWTNAISIQFLLNTKRPPKSDFGWRTYRYYAAYSWGSAALVTACMAIISFTLGAKARKGIGQATCWFQDKTTQWHYMYSVMSILIIANISIFIYVSIILWRATLAVSHLKALKYKFTMTLRLFVLMGISWIFEMVSSLMEINIIWTIIDIINALQGLLIFIVLVPTRKKTVKAMYNHGWLHCMGAAVEKYLAAGNDDEQDVMEHNGSLPLASAQ